MAFVQPLLPTSWEPCACPCPRGRLRGLPPRACSPSACPPVQRERTFLLWENLNERPVCSQSESFCFGKSQFLPTREGRDKEGTEDSRERRSESEGRWEGIGVTRVHTAAPLGSLPNPTHRSVRQASPEACALGVASCCLGKQS